MRELGVPEEDIRTILSHGYGICSDVEPVTDMEKSLFTVDELTGIVQAAALMRPTGISDMETQSAETESATYRLDGQRVTNIQQPGLYVSRGQRIMVK